MSNHLINENKAKYIIANCILCLEFLHEIGYVYRDLKPENILLDKNGNLKLSDFKLMREIYNINFHDTSGTIGYIAPEIILNQNHGCASDIYSLGVIIYEIMIGSIPYPASNRSEYKNKIVNEIKFVHDSDLSEGWSRESADFINKCIRKRPISRIGYNTLEELKDHRWFYDINWQKLKENKIPPLFIPNRNNKYKIRRKNMNMNVFEDDHIRNINNYIYNLEAIGSFEGYFYDDIYNKYQSETVNINSVKYKKNILGEILEFEEMEISKVESEYENDNENEENQSKSINKSDFDKEESRIKEEI